MHRRSAGLDRRQFIAGTLLIAGGVATGATTLRWPQTHPELTVIDRRFAALRDPVHASGRTLLFSADLTALWRDSLAPLWKQRAATVAGITTGPALFCLEQLARGTRHVVTRREELGTSGAVAWLIVPVH
jgi:hypothetical protein